MTDPLPPPRLPTGGNVRVIAPSFSLQWLGPEVISRAERKLNQLGYLVSFGERAEEMDSFNSSGLSSRVADIHDAFQDPDVDAILTAIGGWNSNQLLDRLDWGIIARTPKILCGYSDITALQLAYLSQCKSITYSGPHFWNFGSKTVDHYTQEYFLNAVTHSSPYELPPSEHWSNDDWHLNQDDREFRLNTGPWVINEGQATGLITGGNLGRMCLTFGTEYCPSFEQSILFVEEFRRVNVEQFEAELVSTMQQAWFGGVAGLLIGRFEDESRVTRNAIHEIIRRKPELDSIPVVANLDFGHTDPFFTVPLGGKATMNAERGSCRIGITCH